MRLHHFPEFPSKYVPPRQIDIWLPPGYNPETRSRYPVLYMHDGQNLFEPEHAFIGVDWGIDPALNRLIEKDAIWPPLVVGIWNTPNRIGEYMPEGAFQTPEAAERLSAYLSTRWPEQSIEIKGDDYLAFLIKELKPWIDANFPTRPEPAHTFLMGSSMGGLISLYGLCRYPEVFGGAACLSNAWNIGGQNLLAYFQAHLPAPDGHKLYLDMGGAENNEDSPYITPLAKFNTAMQRIAMQAGYREEDNLLTRIFATHIHSEKDWRTRVHIPLRFLLSPPPKTTDGLKIG